MPMLYPARIIGILRTHTQPSMAWTYRTHAYMSYDIAATRSISILVWIIAIVLLAHGYYACSLIAAYICVLYWGSNGNSLLKPPYDTSPRVPYYTFRTWYDNYAWGGTIICNAYFCYHINNIRTMHTYPYGIFSATLIVGGTWIAYIKRHRVYESLAARNPYLKGTFSEHERMTLRRHRYWTPIIAWGMAWCT